MQVEVETWKWKWKDGNATLNHQLTVVVLLRYAIVTRPVRQGRLKLALEEVLTSRPDPNDPSALQTPHHSATAAPSASSLTTSSSSSGGSLQSASSPGRPPQGMTQTALGQNGNAPVQPISLQRREDSHRSSGLLSNSSDTFGSQLPLPCELAPLQSMGSLAGSNPSSHGAEPENALQTRRHSLHRAPKVCTLLFLLPLCALLIPQAQGTTLNSPPFHTSHTTTHSGNCIAARPFLPHTAYRPKYVVTPPPPPPVKHLPSLLLTRHAC